MIMLPLKCNHFAWKAKQIRQIETFRSPISLFRAKLLLKLLTWNNDWLSHTENRFSTLWALINVCRCIRDWSAKRCLIHPLVIYKIEFLRICKRSWIEAAHTFLSCKSYNNEQEIDAARMYFSLMKRATRFPKVRTTEKRLLYDNSKDQSICASHNNTSVSKWARHTARELANVVRTSLSRN